MNLSLTVLRVNIKFIFTEFRNYSNSSVKNIDQSNPLFKIYFGSGEIIVISVVLITNLINKIKMPIDLGHVFVKRDKL